MEDSLNVSKHMLACFLEYSSFYIWKCYWGDVSDVDWYSNEIWIFAYKSSWLYIWNLCSNTEESWKTSGEGLWFGPNYLSKRFHNHKMISNYSGLSSSALPLAYIIIATFCNLHWFVWLFDWYSSLSLACETRRATSVLLVIVYT